MDKVCFDLETITPLFMAGADGKTPELRPPSFKGMIRFWWRAMRAENTIENLSKDEAGFFGGTGEGQGKSKIKLKIMEKKLITENLFKTDRTFPGVAYLLYSIPMQKKGCFKAGSRFYLEISSRDEKVLKQAEAAFWLAINLGGFGARSRRGGGNIAVIDCSGINKEHTNELKTRHLLTKDIQAHIQHGFNYAKEIITQYGTSKYSNLTEVKIYVGEEEKATWQNALEVVGKPFMDYRNRQEPDYTTVVDFLLGKHNNTPLEKVKFGLPLGGRFNNNPKVKGKRFQIEPNIDKDSKRRASPLIIKILRKDNLHVPILVVLSGDFLPKNKKLVMIDNTTRNRSPKDYTNIDIVSNFITTALPTFKEVTL